MILRSQHLRAMSEPQLREFEDFMVEHLSKWFPRECQVLGEPRTRGRIRSGIDRADGYGITGRRDVCKFIDLMFALGAEFDKSSQYPWARRILDNEALGPSEKTDELVQAALAHRRAVPE